MAIVVIDVEFDAAEKVREIRYRLAPIDVGFDLRDVGCKVAVDPADDPIRVSYPARDGSVRVMAGPQARVLERLRALGFEFTTGGG